jgi:putative membrane protein insertion efficiency factor
MHKAATSVRGRVLSGVGFVVCVAIAWNAQTLALHSIDVYQRTLAGPAARIGLRCRFTPTCSRYAQATIARDGIVRGGWRAFKRVARCGPWTSPGTRDDP